MGQKKSYLAMEKVSQKKIFSDKSICWLSKVLKIQFENECISSAFIIILSF